MIDSSQVFDISDENEIIRFVSDASMKIGLPDILINCAGANTARANVADIKTSDLEWMLKINMIAPFIFMRETYKQIAGKKAGLFINILSTVCRFSNEGIGAYTASKAGLDALTNVFRKEVRGNRIRICSVYPGGVNTAFRENPRPDYLAPEAVADAVLAMTAFDENTAVDELVLRPIVEKNYC